MPVRALGYVIVEATDLEKWRQFALATLGLMEGPPGEDGSLRLRIDERPFRMAVIPSQTNRFTAAGWEFGDLDEFDACLEGLRAADIPVRMGTAAEAAGRLVKRLATCHDPSGNPLELYVGRANDHAPFASSRGLTGFVASEQGMGHVVLPAVQLVATREFYKKHLG